MLASEAMLRCLLVPRRFALEGDHALPPGTKNTESVKYDKRHIEIMFGRIND